MTLVIRADGNARIGTGHVMRCLALAQGWQRYRGQAVFTMAESTPAIENRLRHEGVEVVRLRSAPGSIADAMETIDHARIFQASWIVADGYCFGATWQKEIKNAGLRLLLFDDFGHAVHYCADLVLNQNLHADANVYARREHYTRLLLGTRFVQLRREFLDWRSWQRKTGAVGCKVLVTLGGSDPDNVTYKVIQSLACLCDVEAVVVVGGSNPNLELLQLASRNLQSAIRLVVDAMNMSELMAWADVAVASGGSTSWELAFMGLPSIVIVTAANQSSVAASLDREGVTVNLGEHVQVSVEQITAGLQLLIADSPRRARTSRYGRALVDGLGVSRACSRMWSALLNLHRATEEDCRIIWEWNNNPDVRAVSFSHDLIPWESHVRWYESKSRDPNCFFYVATNGSGTPIGQIRFDLIDNEGIVSVSLDQAARGKGYGSALIARGVEQFFAESTAIAVHAYVKVENQASVRVFENAGFGAVETVNICEQRSLHFSLTKESIL